MWNDALRWTVVLPIKGGPEAKSRLNAGWELAAAIGEDTLAAATSCPAVAQVLVVTADPAVAATVVAANARVIPESAPGTGLGPAIADALVAAPGGPVAVLLADLPALRPEDLGSALLAAGAVLTGQRETPAPAMVAVPDAEATGTVLLAALSAQALDPAFGAGSFAEHQRRGATGLGWELARLRRDVDTPGDLTSAVALGVGRRTAAVLGRRTLGPCRPPSIASTR